MNAGSILRAGVVNLGFWDEDVSQRMDSWLISHKAFDLQVQHGV